MDRTQQHSELTPRLGRYDIDPEASRITFRTDHLLGLAPVRGTMAVRAGTVTVAEPLAESSVYAEIEAASFRTSNAQRDRAVRSARFLDASRYPALIFRLGALDAAAGAVTGTLTVREVTAPVSLTVEVTEASGDAFNVRARTRIDRTEFGVTALRGLAGRFLRILLEVRCARM
jgi:polyisoprenoid-binding protein YceI